MSSTERTGGRRHASRRSGVVLAAWVAATLALGACTASTTTEDPAVPDVAVGAADVARQPPGLDAGPAASVAPVPDPGTVTLIEGPFTARVHLDGLTLVDGRLTGTLDVVSDVSELLALELDAAWYDADGALVGSSRTVVDPATAEQFHTVDGIADLPFDIPTPGAVSATLAIPVLVNE